MFIDSTNIWQNFMTRLLIFRSTDNHKGDSLHSHYPFSKRSSTQRMINLGLELNGAVRFLNLISLRPVQPPTSYQMSQGTS